MKLFASPSCWSHPAAAHILTQDIRQKSQGMIPAGAAHPGHLRGPRLTFTPKSGDVELQMAPMLAAASMASKACALLGK